jgi:hypothetical protein
MENLTQSGQSPEIPPTSRSAVRSEAVERVSTQIATGTYHPPLDALVDHLVVVLAPFVRSGR